MPADAPNTTITAKQAAALKEENALLRQRNRRLQEFVQWVADHSSDPTAVAKAVDRGARQ